MNSELWRRRVPHIVGTYVAAMWLLIEIGDWLVERFGLPADLTSFTFVAMMVFLPGVAVWAWGHGAPGKDQWTTFQRAFLPINFVLALGFGYSVTGPAPNNTPDETAQAAPAAVAPVVLVDESGQQVEFSVPTQGNHRRVLVYFWPTSGEQTPDWLAYGVPWMLSMELTRHPQISAVTPFSSDRVRERLLSVGFDRAINEPASLQLEIANQRVMDAFVAGSVTRDGDNYRLNAEVYSARHGQIQHRFEQTGDSLFALVDNLSVEIRNSLGIEVIDQLSIANSSSEHLSDSMEAIELAVRGKMAQALDNDYVVAADLLKQAAAIDPTFALASGNAAVVQRLNGQMADAVVLIDAALEHAYKLDSETQFQLRSMRYSMRNEVSKAVRVIQMWTQVHPQSPDAFLQLARILIILGTNPEEAIAAYETVLSLSPEAIDVYLSMSDVYRQMGRFDDAVAKVRLYLDQRGGDASAYNRIGNIWFQAGEIDKARGAYEQASLLADDPRAADLALARLEISEGSFAAADQQITALVNSAKTAREEVEALMMRLRLRMAEGRMQDAVEVLNEADQRATEYMIPIERVFSFGLQLASVYAAAGDNERAMQTVDELATDLQPPLDSFVEFGRLSIYQIMENREGYAASLDKLKTAMQAMPNPVLTPVLQSAEATLAAWDHDYESAIELFESALESIRRSFLSLQDPFQERAMQLQYATTLREAGQLEQASEQFDILLQQFPGFANAHAENAKLLNDLGNLEQATAAMAKAMDLWKNADEGYVDYVKAKEYASQLAAATNVSGS